jgi:hypothetical protein
MNRLRWLGREWGRLARIAILTAALGLITVPAVALASAGTENKPEGVPPKGNGTENPGTSHQPSNHEARALGRNECQEFKQNFGENKSQFGRCIAAVATALRTDATPQEACAAHHMSHRRQRGERRSDFSACVVSTRRALRQLKRGG